MLDYLRRLYDHLSWADEAAVGALRAAEAPPARAVEILAHVLGAEEVWLSRLEQRAARLAVWPELTPEGCAGAALDLRNAFGRYLDALSPRDLDRYVPYTNSAGQSFQSTRWDILMHVAMHGSYHRGQVMLLLRSAGHEPAPTDYIAFVRGVPAATRR